MAPQPISRFSIPSLESLPEDIRARIWDIAAIAAFFALSNRLANFTTMRPNDEFYLTPLRSATSPRSS
jgi:hypothetical protein